MFQLRPFQQECVRAIRHEWQTVDHTLVVAATGAGKSIIALGLIDELLQENPQARFLFMVHRKELAMQPLEKMERFFPHLRDHAGLVMAEADAVDAQIMIATVQTLNSSDRLVRCMAAGAFDYIISDESHHDTSPSRMAVLAQMTGKVVGFTATPMRTDNDGLSKIFQSCAYRFPIDAAIKQGVLVPFQALGFTLPITFKGIGQTQDGWSPEPVGDLLKAENILEIIHKKWNASGGSERLTMGFTASVAQAYASAEYFRAQGVPSEAADGTTPKDEREAILGRFQRGETRVLWNCQLFTEGYDCPEISCLIMAAPTKSDLIYVQRLGRGLRPAPGKSSCSVLDFAPMATRNVIMAGDVLGLPREVRDASEAAEEQGILLGGLSVDRFGRISTIDPTAVLVQHLNYISAQSRLAWSVGNRYTTATLNERVMVGIVLPNTERIEELERLQHGDTWGEAQELRLTFARQSHVILMTKADRGWWESETWGDFDNLTDAHEATAKLEQVYGDNALAARTRRWRGESASPAQLNLMKKWKIKYADDVSKGTASQLLSQWVANRTMDGWLKAAEQAATQLSLFA